MGLEQSFSYNRHSFWPEFALIFQILHPVIFKQRPSFQPVSLPPRDYLTLMQKLFNPFATVKFADSKYLFVSADAPSDLDTKVNLLSDYP